ncbi:multiple epidermal growth factor-like domains protein 6 [Acinonyx jubatus]|uniref:Multiple epidermal growth factor-like domains protein 6 n=1 Tax=Acinonyx jubatus TaxID=32536 RepID=A0A6J1ZIR3_ACIJB|nr:multiple epidermal growth factor-like domains protein 6 [Acinonyx jubatus]
MPLPWQPALSSQYCDCQVCPPGTYGKDCKQVCQCSAENEKCHPVTGRYTCLPGYHGNRCHLRCPEGTYDLNCQRMHKYLNGGSCDTVIGTYHCPPGFIGADCSQTCPEDHHGRDCVQPCSCGSGQCDPVTGRCQCPPGKMRARCQQGNNGCRVTLSVQALTKLHYESRCGAKEYNSMGIVYNTFFLNAALII